MDAAPLTPPAPRLRLDRLAPLPAAVLFATRTSLTALAALYIAFSAGMERPAWSMVTVFILSQPISGGVLAKSLYRAIGTLAGAVFTLFAVPAFLDMPALLLLVMSSWMGLCLYLNLRDRSPRAYAFALAGYTSAIIGFSSLDSSLAVFEVAQARVQEIVVGLICATLAAALILPQTAQAAATRRIGTWLHGANVHAIALLRGTLSRKDLARNERRLAADIASLHALMIFLGYEPALSEATRRNVLGVFHRSWIMIQVLAEIRDRLEHLRAEGGLDPALEDLLPQLAEFLASGPTTPAPEGVRLIQALERVAAPWQGADWREAEQMNLAAHLVELIHLIQDCRTLWQATDIGRVVAEEELAVEAPRSGRALPAIDFNDALRATAALVLGLWILGAFWILAAWPQGAGAMIMVAIISCITAAQQDAGAAVGGYITAVVISIATAFVYQFAVLPLVQGFFELAIVMLPTLFVMAFMVALPDWNSMGMRLSIMFTAILGLQNMLSQNFVEFVNANLAVLIGMIVVRTLVAILRPAAPAEEVSERLQRAAFKDIAALCAAPKGSRRDGIVRRLTDRIGLMKPVAEPRDLDAAEAVFAASFAAQGVLSLTGEGMDGVPASERGAVKQLLRDVATHYQDLATRKPAPLGGITAALDGLRARLSATGQGKPAVIALVSLRRGLMLEAQGDAVAGGRAGDGHT